MLQWGCETSQISSEISELIIKNHLKIIKNLHAFFIRFRITLSNRKYNVSYMHNSKNSNSHIKKVKRNR